jgi:hypothetical protein
VRKATIRPWYSWIVERARGVDLRPSGAARGVPTACDGDLEAVRLRCRVV